MIAEVTKYCPGCAMTRAGKCFARDASRRDGLFEYCRLCTVQRQRNGGKSAEWYASDEKRQAHITRVRERQERCRFAGVRPSPPRPHGGHNHAKGQSEKTACGWPAKAKTYKVVTPGCDGERITCTRCLRVLAVLFDCPALTPEQVATAAKARAGRILTKAARRK